MNRLVDYMADVELENLAELVEDPSDQTQQKRIYRLAADKLGLPPGGVLQNPSFACWQQRHC